MIPFLIAFAVACMAFSKMALKILGIVVIFLVISGAITIIQYLHHVR